jgi:hypothetical protein
MQLNKVDFPEPLGPTSENISPDFTSNETSSSATTPENCIHRFLMVKSLIKKVTAHLRKNQEGRQ